MTDPAEAPESLSTPLGGQGLGRIVDDSRTREIEAEEELRADKRLAGFLRRSSGGSQAA